MNKENNTDKELAKLFYNLYIGCIAYKDKKEENNINCNEYYDKFKFFSEKYVDKKSGF